MANFMMIVIPVMIVLLVMVGILFGILEGKGSGLTVTALEKFSSKTTNYQLQVMVDSLSEELVENAQPFAQGSAFLGVCEDMEGFGTEILVLDGTDILYRTPGASEREMLANAAEIGAGKGDTPLFLRNENGFVYRTQTDAAGTTYSVFVVNRGLAYDTGEYYVYEQIKTQLKILLVAMGGTAILIIVLTGVILSKKVSRSILAPLRQLSRATTEIRNGNLDYAVDFRSGDEMGQVCEEFDEMRRRLKKSVLLQQQYAREQQEMIAGISHDLLTPITSIKGYVSGIVDGIADTPEKQEHYLRTIYDTACDMDQLVENLFLFSKLGTDKMPFHMERTDLAAYLLHCCGELRLGIEKHDMELVFENRCAGHVWTKIDRAQLGRVLKNLADNSVKYRKKDASVKSRINIVLEDVGEGAVRIVFSDNGSGIGEAEAEKIFESFYRGDPARGNAAKGSGLGLSIARRIVMRMGGKIFAQGRPGLGLAVMIVLPRQGE
ncbi:MAG: HAMP domain-containing sensor histidine kinase [Christensenella sp.]|uniref:sensor histidine kinase n=1 Tax=Christensenella sp. TaxID=1935934 RepID=UPI002B1EEDE7|nr:HAMP domain-containing sensor histidine kinase [Christensenella sp.]MEA5003518.1 HAMP domain-containing sensor histidine kinase [Christensenella sp.]